ncbi:helicase-related protein [Oceanicella actignis]|uniref:helicase-related protein n=1 Tax=Oceanicella actignis TaxID=1189325 RepID=UPI0011E6F3E8|nr:helicase-related protein [Oceanicella actignis]TYO89592.1 ATP-dependent RNA helicase SUPV3L1/SUV3 [Oceanicella actignis]
MAQDAARAPIGHPRDSTVTAVLGPTNTGKTHYAIERMLGHESGVIGLPLRLLAREVYDRVVALRGPSAAALLTGEEKIVPPRARYWICTVEAMPVGQGHDFLAVDEIQLCADPDRGHIFTDRLLNARGMRETLFLGSETMRERIRELIPRARFLRRERFSRLSYAGARKLSRLPPRSAVVAFSAESVYAIAELMRRQKGGVAVVLGALSPRTRNAQVALYQNGDVEHLVATDAIGMGLNLDLGHVAFAGLSKFDGARHRQLTAPELAQIAGRAGRHVNDGSFGVTAEAAPLEPELVEAIESHRFAPVRRLNWRNSRLDFGSVPALLAALERAPELPGLTRAREADDLRTLRLLWEDPQIRDMARGPAMVRLLWEVCQLPDFRKTSEAEHARLAARIYRFLASDKACISSDWMESRVRSVDRADGDIDALSRRLAYIRTWTYVANRRGWVEDAARWRETAREVEDRLSDALHARLTQRFVDRRTSVLMRRLKQKESLVAEVNDKGEVTAEGHALGRLDGFRFTPDPEARGDEARTLRAASNQALQSEFSRRADRFYNAPDTEIDLTEQGGLMWGEHAVGRLVKGADPLSPGVAAFVDEMAGDDVRLKVERRLTHWINRRVNALFEPLIKMRDDEALTGLARGVAFQLVEALGVIPRPQIAQDVKSLDQEGRGQLRKHGVRFGQHTVFMPALLKPAPTRLRLILWGLWEEHDEFAPAPPPGLVTIPAQPGLPEDFYPRAGYRLAGSRAIRIDMLERLADMIRALDARAGFEATADMLSITGCTLDQFAELMEGLGYKAEKRERPKPAPARAPKATDGAAESAATQEAAEAPAAEAPAAETPDAQAAQAPAQAEASEAPESAADAPQTAQDSAAPAAEAKSEAPAPEAEAEATDGTDAPAEDAPPQVEMQTYYVFTWAPRPRREGGRGRRAEGARPAQGRRAAEGGKGRDDARPKGKPRGKPKPKGKGAPRDEAPRQFAARPPRQDKPVDPDSPFAALLALKDKI